MPNFDKNAGYGNSDKGTFTITAGNDGSAVTPIDLLRHFAFVVVRIADVSFVAAPSNTLSLFIGMTASDDMLELEDNDGEVLIVLDDTFHRTVFVGAARRIRAVLSANASGGSVVIEFYGVDGSTKV